MKLLHLAILTTALSLPLAGCGDPAPGENEKPANVSDQPGDDPFAGGTDLIETEDGKAALTAPPIDFLKEGGGPSGGR